MDVTGVGNHEFDEGIDELQRMQYGNQLGGDGCHPVDGCQDGTPFGGSLFQYLAANVFFAGTDETIFPPYEIRKVGNAKIAFIGLTFEGTPTVVTPSAVEGLEFRPEVGDGQRARGQAAQRAGRQGVRRAAAPGRRAAAAVAAARSRGRRRPATSTPTSNRCVNFNGPEMQAIAAGLDPRVGVIVSAHTHQPYICTMAGKLVTSAASFGRVVTDIELTIDHQIEARSPRRRPTTTSSPRTWRRTPHAKAILDKYTTLVGTAREPGDRRDHRRHPLGARHPERAERGRRAADGRRDRRRDAGGDHADRLRRRRRPRS